MMLILLVTGQKGYMQAEQALHVRYLWCAGWSGKLSQLLLCANNMVIALQSIKHTLQDLPMPRLHRCEGQWNQLSQYYR